MEKRKERKNILTILMRYLILLALMFTLPLIYKIFTPLTIYPVLWLLKIFFNNVVILRDMLIIPTETVIQLIPACIAGSAYLLLLILNLSVPMSYKKRVFSLTLSFALLLLLNILRIFFLAILYYNKFVLFDFTHKIFWYLLSTIFVVAIWFFTVKIFSIKEIPAYSDMKVLIKNIKKR